MQKLIINGGRKLAGTVDIQGSKNSVLPILAATLTGEGQCVIRNCPHLSDTEAACDILRHLGCQVIRQEDAVIVNAGSGGINDIPDELMRKMRSSVMFLGAILTREKSARISFPGGCELGPRPIDLHISALRQMGVRVSEEGGFLSCTCPNGLRGTSVSLAIPSVGATENIMLAAVKAKGETVIHNAACEPEIVDLQNFLNAMGARIQGAGTSRIAIEGVERLRGTEHRIIPDRIVAATYLVVGCMGGGKVELCGVIPEHVAAITGLLTEMGVKIRVDGRRIMVYADTRPLAPRTVRTTYYPGFPTDAQALMMALACICRGSSLFIETVFENRYRHVGELRRMGARIQVEQRVAVVEGVEKLWGANVEATDLRGGAALMCAALAAQGTTVIERIEHIDRGYQTPERALSALGADIKREDYEAERKTATE